MSAILEALKKLEKDAAGVEAEGRQGPPLRGSDQARPAFLIAAGLVLLMVFGAGVWKLATLSMQSPSSTRAEKPPVTASRDFSNRSDKVTVIRKPKPAEQADRRKTNMTQASPGVREENAQESADTPAQQISQHRREPAAEPAAGASEPQKPAGQTDDGESRMADPAPEPGPNPAKADPAPEPEVMQDGPLTLQAISWAQAPQNRMAVINGKICRQGDRIGGYRVEVIHPEGVQVTDGQETWQLIFRLR